MNDLFPDFFNDSERKPHSKFESLVDFWLSWTLRCSVESVKSLNEKIYNNSKKILSYFITKKQDIYSLDNKEVKDVYFNKYYKDIDLLVEVELYNSDKKYILVFENKVFSSLKDHQLDKYKEIIINDYNEKDYDIIYIFFRANDKYFENDIEYCKKSNFLPVLITDLQNKNNNLEITGNDLFDTFWFKW